MAPKKTAAGKAKQKSSARDGAYTGSTPPKPFKVAPDSLEPLYKTLLPTHVYVVHVDEKPAAFKRKIFVVPVLMNLFVALAFAWRLSYIGPWYLRLFTSTLGYENETTLRAADLAWRELGLVVLRRGFTFLLDFILAVFVWPWPLEFVFGGQASEVGGSPVAWRFSVGFRDKEIYVRRSRENWDRNVLGPQAADFLSEKSETRTFLWSQIGVATSSVLVKEKTGYLTMNEDWDLDWPAMIRATRLVDKRTIALDAFKKPLVLIHHERFGWLTLDPHVDDNGHEEERRRQVFAFRDALVAIGQEDLFFRWIEIVQFETTQPGGFTVERQVQTAQKIRDLFKEKGIDFDQFWKDSVGADSLAGMT